MIAPPDDYTWLQGQITHFDFEETLKQRYHTICSGNRTQMKRYEKSLYKPQPSGRDDWMDNLVVFLNENQDRSYHLPEEQEGPVNPGGDNEVPRTPGKCPFNLTL
jgi:hypothetical protein